jgi:hypothetical protein
MKRNIASFLTLRGLAGALMFVIVGAFLLHTEHSRMGSVETLLNISILFVLMPFACVWANQWQFQLRRGELRPGLDFYQYYWSLDSPRASLEVGFILLAFCCSLPHRPLGSWTNIEAIKGITENCLNWPTHMASIELRNRGQLLVSRVIGN